MHRTYHSKHGFKALILNYLNVYSYPLLDNKRKINCKYSKS
jgi:hypothetical protein